MQWGSSQTAAVPRRQALALYNAWRIAQSLFLLGLMLGASFLESSSAIIAPWSWGIAIAYFSYALALALWLRSRQPVGFVMILTALVVDVFFVVVITHALVATGVETYLLLVIVVVAATVLLTSRLALFVAALATVCLLVDYALGSINAFRLNLSATEVGMLGAVLFAVALVGNHLTRIAASSAVLAEQRGADLASLGVVSELVVTHLQSGVLLLDAEDRIRLCNMPGHAALGGQVRAGERLSEKCPALQDLLDRWRRGNDGGRMPRALVGGAPLVLPRFVAVGGGEDARNVGGATLVFLDDTSELSRQAEQMTIQSVGRLGASVAHEIRNPLGAISHAAQLLSESSALRSSDKRLAEIIQRHSRRVNQLVENVLSLSRRRAATPEPVDLPVLLEKFRRQWLGGQAESNVDVVIDSMTGVVPLVLLDRSHAEQILHALADNAVAHGCCADGHCVIRFSVRYESTLKLVSLRVYDDGPGIPSELRAEVFQPFFTTRHEGSGLGLYIVHALCSANSATIDYVDDTDGHYFRLNFRVASSLASE
jgi:two-component system sensor histidine kinase PilS (NtrC family)